MDGDLTEVWKALNDFKLDYERRHGQLSREIFAVVGDISTRIARLEEILKNVATREDITKMDGIVSRMEESLKRFNDKSDAMVTKTDVEWLKKSFWAAIALLSGLDITLAGLLFKHLLGI